MPLYASHKAQNSQKGLCALLRLLKTKLKIKDKRTILKALDRLQLFGYITWENRGKDKTNKYYFRGDENFQHILNNNIRLRKIMSDKHKQIYVDKVRKKFVEKKGIKLVR